MVGEEGALLPARLPPRQLRARPARPRPARAARAGRGLTARLAALVAALLAGFVWEVGRDAPCARLPEGGLGLGDEAIAQVGGDSAIAAPLDVNFVICRSWVHALHPKVVEFMPPAPDGADDEASASKSREQGGSVQRLLMPYHIQDVRLLNLLRLEHLRVELWPRRGPSPGVQVRVLTDALALLPAAPRRSSNSRRRFWDMPWARPRRDWLLVFQATIDVPRDAAIMSCASSWRWAAYQGSEEEQAMLGPRFRVLEVTCPRRLAGFLAPYGGASELNGDRPKSLRSSIGGGLRLAFLAMLITACIGQVVLLIVCLAMLLLQVAMQRGRAEPRANM